MICSGIFLTTLVFMKNYFLLITLALSLSSSIFAQSNHCYLDAGHKGIINICEKIKNEALTGIIESEYNFSQMYLNGIGVEKDEQRLLMWLYKAAKHGHVKAQYDLGITLKNRNLDQNDKEAFKWILKSANQGYSDAQYTLGSMYQYGHGVKRNYSSALSWHKKASAQGNQSANGAISSMYGIGEGVAKNMNNALYWYLRAGEQRNTLAQLRLGYLYHKGIGVQKNNGIAYNWYRKAASNGNQEAQYILNNKRLEADDKTERSKQIKYLVSSLTIFLSMVIGGIVFMQRKIIFAKWTGSSYTNNPITPERGLKGLV